VLGALLVVAGIAAVDSLNPTTIGPALLLGVSEHPVPRILQFSAGFFLVNLAGGVLLVLGPGQLLLSLIPHLSGHAKHLLEVGGGVALLILAVVLWVGRQRVIRSQTDEIRPPSSRSSFVAGAGIALAELPTALPYIAAIAAIDAAPVSVPEQILLVVVFNVIFIAPVVGIAIAIGVSPALRADVIEPFRRWLVGNWPRLIAAIMAIAGVVLLAVGISGLRGD
jgi:cytochrome c biogenesis protein CcdA